MVGWSPLPAKVLERLRAATFRFPGAVCLFAGETPEQGYTAFGKHARIVRHVVHKRPIPRRRNDWCVLSYADLGPALRLLIADGRKVAVFDSRTPADSLERVALSEFPRRTWLEPDGEYLDRVARWEEDYCRPALSVHRPMSGPPRALCPESGDCIRS